LLHFPPAFKEAGLLAACFADNRLPAKQLRLFKEAVACWKAKQPAFKEA
jgi:hypothetical protein